MRTNLILALFLSLSAIGFSQKQALKEASKFVKSGKMAEAKEALKAAEGQLEAADEKMKAQYYFLKAETTVSDSAMTAQEEAANAYLKVMEIEKASGGKKYTTLAAEKLQNLRNELVNKAIADQKESKYKEAAEKLYLGYKTNKADTTYLYFAASNSVNAKDYDNALKYYNELVELGYEGIETQYVAVNKEDGKEEFFNSLEIRDLSVKAGTHIKPEARKTSSKKSEITKNIALIYIDQGKDEEAMKAMEVAKNENPDDTSLMQAEADMYYKLGNVEKYKELMEQIVAKDPSNPDLIYNLGVSASRLGDNEKALEYYNKVLELKPDYSSAQLNIASIILSNEEGIVKQMNALGTSSADYKKYDKLKEKRLDLYRKAIPYLEGALAGSPDNVEAVRTLMNIYYQLDDPKAEEMKGKLKALEGGN